MDMKAKDLVLRTEEVEIEDITFRRSSYIVKFRTCSKEEIEISRWELEKLMTRYGLDGYLGRNFQKVKKEFPRGWEQVYFDLPKQK